MDAARPPCLPRAAPSAACSSTRRRTPTRASRAGPPVQQVDLYRGHIIDSKLRAVLPGIEASCRVDMASRGVRGCAEAVPMSLERVLQEPVAARLHPLPEERTHKIPATASMAVRPGSPRFMLARGHVTPDNLLAGWDDEGFPGGPLKGPAGTHVFRRSGELSTFDERLQEVCRLYFLHFTRAILVRVSYGERRAGCANGRCADAGTSVARDAHGNAETAGHRHAQHAPEVRPRVPFTPLLSTDFQSRAIGGGGAVHCCSRIAGLSCRCYCKVHGDPGEAEEIVREACKEGRLKPNSSTYHHMAAIWTSHDQINN